MREEDNVENESNTASWRILTRMREEDVGACRCKYLLFANSKNKNKRNIMALLYRCC
jgi:hypothetical protein